MNTNKVLKVLKFILLGIIFITAMGWVVMSLWNWLMPYLFSGKVISYWQALGILVLCKILFGGMKGTWRQNHCNKCDSGHFNNKMEARMAKMTEEERLAFKSKFYNKCKEKWGCDWNEEKEIQ